MKLLDTQGHAFIPGDRCIWYCKRDQSWSGVKHVPVEVVKTFPSGMVRVKVVTTGRMTLVLGENLMEEK